MKLYFYHFNLLLGELTARQAIANVMSVPEAQLTEKVFLLILF